MKDLKETDYEIMVTMKYMFRFTCSTIDAEITYILTGYNINSLHMESVHPSELGTTLNSLKIQIPSS